MEFFTESAGREVTDPRGGRQLHDNLQLAVRDYGGEGPHLMLFDLYEGGHHSQYIEQLVEFWLNSGVRGRLSVVIPAQWADRWVSLSKLIDQNKEGGVEIVPIKEPVSVDATRRFKLLRNDIEHARLLRKYIELLRPDHCILMYFDHVQLSLAFGLRFKLPVNISGIYFRPTFHYGDLVHTRLTWKERIHAFRKRLVLAASLRNRHVKVLYCLDPYVVPRIGGRKGYARGVFLPDGAKIDADHCGPVDVRAKWGVESERKVVLMFGALDERKGLLQALDSMFLLPAQIQEKVCLVLAGPIGSGVRQAAYSRMARIRRETQVAMVVDDRVVPTDEAQSIVAAADLVLVTYQRHVGSSNVLVRAAAAMKPVVGSEFGVVGENISRRQLGAATDTTKPENVGYAVRQFIESPSEFPFDTKMAMCFAQENSDVLYAKTIFSSLGLWDEGI